MTKLREKRLDAGFKLVDVADAAQVSYPFMTDLEHGRRGARLDTWQRIAAVLGCDIEAIVEDKQLERFKFRGEIHESAC